MRTSGSIRICDSSGRLSHAMIVGFHCIFCLPKYTTATDGPCSLARPVTLEPGEDAGSRKLYMKSGQQCGTPCLWKALQFIRSLTGPIGMSLITGTTAVYGI